MITPEDDTYEPEIIEIGDGGVLLQDPVEFYEMTNSFAAMVRDGGLFVLCRDTLKWVNVEDALKKSRAKLATVASNP